MINLIHLGWGGVLVEEAENKEADPVPEGRKGGHPPLHLEYLPEKLIN